MPPCREMRGGMKVVKSCTIAKMVGGMVLMSMVMGVLSHADDVMAKIDDRKRQEDGRLEFVRGRDVGVFLTEDGKRYFKVVEFPGVSPWRFVRHMFDSAKVVVRCPGAKNFDVFVGQDIAEVFSSEEHHDAVWCGWERAFGKSKDACVVPVTPLGSTYIAVSFSKGWFDNSNGTSTCSMEKIEKFSMIRLGITVVGILLFLLAPYIAISVPFRLAGGALGFTFLSTIILLFILYRFIPQKKAFAAFSLAFGSTVFGIIRYTFGVWFPSIYQLIQHPIVLTYWILSALMGLGLTYYYDNLSDIKLNTILRIALRLCGLVMILCSLSSFHASAMLIIGLFSILLGYHARHRFFKAHVSREYAYSSKDGGDISSEQEEEGVEPRTPSGRYEIEQDDTPTQVSPLVARGKILNEDTGRVIGIGKGKYNELVLKGYTPDFEKGIITPPSQKASRMRRRK